MNPAYRTSDVTALAARIRDERAYHLLPIIADALQDAGCYEPWLESLRAGLPEAEAAGYLVPDGWWEYARLGEKLEKWPNCELVRDWGTRCSERIGVFCRSCQLRSRRAELLRLHTRACPTCADRKNLVLVNDDGNISTGHFIANPCPTCVLAVRERWDRAKCPSCQQFKIAPGTTPCEFCGGSGDLLLRMHEYENDHFARLHPQPRPLSFDGPLPVVSARVEEIAEEVECENCGGDGSLTRFRGPGATNAYRDDCDSCSGTGRIARPTAWLRALPVWWEVDVEGVEPVHSRFPGEENEDGFTWWKDSEYRDDRSFASQGLLPDWIWDRLPGEARDSVHSRQYFRYPSPTAARQALIAALRRFRFSSPNSSPS